MLPEKKTLALFAALLIAAGCSTTVPDFYTESGKHVSDVEPATYKVAILPFKGAVKQGPSSEGLSFGYRNNKQFRDKVIEELKSLNFASQVKPVDSEAEAVGQNFDLVVRPTLNGTASLGHTGYPTGGTIGAACAWITTWLGGLFCEDCTYSAGVGIDYSIVNAHTRTELLGVKARCQSVDLDFFERNEAWGGQFFLTMLLPPQWTYDDAAVTSASISDRAVSQVAARLVKDVKDRLRDEVAKKYGAIQFKGLRNGQTAATNRIILDAELTSPFPIGQVKVFLGKTNVRIASFADTGRVATQVGGKRTYTQKINVGITLKPGDNFIRVSATFNQKLLSRTIRILGPS